MGVHKYSVNDAVRVDFGVFPSAISGLQASTNFWVHLVNSNKSSLIYQSYEDTMNFPKGFAQKFKTFFHNNINFFPSLELSEHFFSKKRLLRS